MAVTYAADGGIDLSASAGSTVDPVYPTGISSTTSELVLVVGQKPVTANGGGITDPSGWTAQVDTIGGGYTTTIGNDTGNVLLKVYTKDTVAGSESGALSVALTDNAIAWAVILRLERASGATMGWAVGVGSKDTGGATMAFDTAAGVDITSGDVCLFGVVIPSDAGTGDRWSAQSLTQSGTTFDAATEIGEGTSGLNSDVGGYVAHTAATAGGGSGVVTLSAVNVSVTNTRGPGFVLRAREVGGGAIEGAGAVSLALTTSAVGVVTVAGAAAVALTVTTAAAGGVAITAAAAVALAMRSVSIAPAATFTHPNAPTDDPNPPYDAGTGTGGRIPVTTVAPPPGFPTPLTTGLLGVGLVPTDLTTSGSVTVTTNGAVVQDLDIIGTLTIDADNVTVRRCRIIARTGNYGARVMTGRSGALIEDTRIILHGAELSTALYMQGTDNVARRLHISGGADTIKLEGDGQTVEDCYVAGSWYEPGGHNDGLQCRVGDNHRVRRNTVCGPYQGQTSAMLFQAKTGAGGGDILNVLIESNALSGGTYSLYTDEDGFEITGEVRNNWIELDSYQFGPTSGDPGPVFTSNVTAPWSGAIEGAGAVSLALTTSAVGVVTVAGAAAVALTLTAEASTTATVEGAAAVSLTVTTAAAGVVTVAGAAAVSLVLTAAAELILSPLTEEFNAGTRPSGWLEQFPLAAGTITYSASRAHITVPSGTVHDSISSTSNPDNTVGLIHTLADHGGDVDIAVQVDTDVSDQRGWGLNLLCFGATTADAARFAWYHNTSATEDNPQHFGYLRAAGSGASTGNANITQYMTGVPSWLRIRYTSASGLWESLDSTDGHTWTVRHSGTRSFTPQSVKFGVSNSPAATSPTIRLQQVVDVIAAGTTDLRALLPFVVVTPVAEIVGTEGTLPTGWVDDSTGAGSTLTMTGTAMRMTHDCTQDNTPPTVGGAVRVRWSTDTYTQWGLLFAVEVITDNSNAFLTVGAGGYDGTAWIDQYVSGPGYGLEVQLAQIRRPIRIDNPAGTDVIPTTFSTDLNEVPYCWLANLSGQPDIGAGGVRWFRLERVWRRYRAREWADGDAEPTTWNLWDGQDQVEDADQAPFFALSHNGVRTGSAVVDVSAVELYELDTTGWASAGSASMALAAQATGSVAVLAAGSGALTLNASASGGVGVLGAGAVSLALTTSAVGVVTVAGAAAVALTLTAQGSVAGTVAGAAAVVVIVTATAAGVVTVAGAGNAALILTAVLLTGSTWQLTLHRAGLPLASTALLDGIHPATADVT